MELTIKKKSKNLFVPLIFLTIIIVILLIIFVFVTYRNIQRQEAEYARLTLLKGDSLIRSVEAGARFGMQINSWGNQRLQQLLVETGQLPDIEYIFLVDETGRVIAHSDPKRVGQYLQTELDLEKISNVSQATYRFTVLENNVEVFEVFRQFVPGRNSRHRMMEREMMKPFLESPLFRHLKALNSSVIFVGFNIEADLKANNTAKINAIFSGVLLFLATAAGLVLLFVYQNYRSAKSSLTRIQAFSDQLVDNMPIGVITVDTSFRLTSLNQAAESILGIEEQAIIGKSAESTLPDDIWTWMQTRDPQTKFIEGELDYHTSENQIKPTEISLSKMLSETGEPFGSIILIKDLTEIQSLRKEIARSQRMASLGRLAAGVAHEIRNPLSSIKGFATYFKTRYKDVEKDVNIANIMIQETERLNRSVGQLLEIAKPIKIQPVLCDSTTLLKDSLKLVESAAEEKGIEISFSVQDNATQIGIDRDRVSQMLLNLYLNAIEAMETGGFLNVSIDTHGPSGMITITVEDSGSGISEADIAKIYDPYFTTKNTGTGLGLAVVHNIVEAHGGRIEVSSQEGEGTTFTLHIPNKI